MSATNASAGTPDIRAAFELATRKARANICQLATSPRAWIFAADGHYAKGYTCDFHAIENWTASFVPGMALLAWRQTGDPLLLQNVQALAQLYHDKVFRHAENTMHDLGFLYSLYSVALFQLTGDRAHREVGLRAAEILAARFNSRGKFIRAWGRMDDTNPTHAGLAIIDCMMNLPLLFWAAQETGNATLRQIAMAHADTTLRHFIRADDSVCHAFRFDPVTGAPLEEANYCGHRIGSHWARGTAWAIYGFALAHRYTREHRYRTAARRLAEKFLASLDAEIVPVWDFRLSPGFPPLRDSSAAAIAACGLMELASAENDPGLAGHARRLLEKLCNDYLERDETCPGLLRNGQVGDETQNQGDRLGAQNVFTVWGDYFLMEALARELFGARPWW